MGWPTTFASLSGAQPLSLFDAMFTQVAQMVAIPCGASIASNALTVTPNTNAPVPTNYQNFTAARFLAPSTTTAAVTAQVGTLPLLPVYLSDGATQVTTQIAVGEEYVLVYAGSLNSGAGGFFLEQASVGASSGGGSIPSGTVLVGFQQSAAPSGWTKVTTFNDYAMRIVNGTVGTTSGVAFSTVFAQTATAAETLTTTQIPSHAHSIANASQVQDSGSPAGCGPTNNTPTAATITSTGGVGSGGSHQHNVTLNVNYLDVIICSKN
jgi:hypothetical protein